MPQLIDFFTFATVITSLPVTVLAQTSRAVERPEPPAASEIIHELSGWFAAHPGVEFALGVCVVTAIASMIYNRLRG